MLFSNYICCIFASVFIAAYVTHIKAFVVALRKLAVKLNKNCNMAKFKQIYLKRHGLKRLCELHPEKSKRTICNYISGKIDAELWDAPQKAIFMAIRRDAMRFSIDRK